MDKQHRLVASDKAQGDIDVYEFMMLHMNRFSELKKNLIHETSEKLGSLSGMLTAPDQAEQMGFLIRLSKAKKGIELGTFTGYSALCMAEQLPEDGKLITVDINPETGKIAKRYWEEAKVDKKIVQVIQPALEYLDELLKDPLEKGTFDFAFIDADKTNYPNYYERMIQLLRPGGFIMFDNILWDGRVADSDKRVNDESTKRIYETVSFA